MSDSLNIHLVKAVRLHKRFYDTTTWLEITVIKEDDTELCIGVFSHHDYPELLASCDVIDNIKEDEPEDVCNEVI